MLVNEYKNVSEVMRKKEKKRPNIESSHENNGKPCTQIKIFSLRHNFFAAKWPSLVTFNRAAHPSSCSPRSVAPSGISSSHVHEMISKFSS